MEVRNKVEKAKKTKKIRRRLINILIVLLFLVGLALIFNKPIRNMLIAGNSNRYQVSNVTRKEIVKNQKAKANFDFKKVSLVDFQSVFANELNRQPLPVIGGISVPDLGINLPIFRGVGNTSLLYGAGTMKENDTMGQGNYALAGHNMTGFTSDLSILFTPLTHAKVGMMIYVTDKANIYEYKLASINVVTPDHVEVIDNVPGKTEITLITCYDEAATHRIVIHGTFEKKIAFSTAPQSILKSFEVKYNQIKNM
ncbi:class A sortase [Lactococcus nasutitermitis]|uniref:Class A sortase n=1 Tax=Lactococcus nasutitermitis TaxID=1652957 RepID=A0ABV9JFG7_9LACT|nr:sortase [Lactococcus nasutitermitis]